MPKQVRIREVGPRDGFQNEPEVVPTADKVRLIELLGRTGLGRIEVTSFVRPDVIPQLADADQVREFFSSAVQALPGVELTAHFHNTRGQGLANVLSALECGVGSFESSFGELGGCPVPPGATGNIATEDLVSMLHEMGIETGVDLVALLTASRAVQDVLGRPLGSHVLTAGPVEWR